MALTASDLVTAAKKRTYGSIGRQKVSDAALLEELSYQDQLIVQMLSQIAPDLLARTTGTVTVTDNGNKNGYSLEGGIHYRDFTHVNPSDDDYDKISVVQTQHQESVENHPAIMVHTESAAAKIFPVDPEGDRWQSSGDREWFEPDENHEIHYSYVPFPSVITNLSDTLGSPDMAREAILSSLELTIMLSNAPGNEARIQAALAKRQGAMDSLRMQAYKFAHPQGQQPGGRATELSDAAWVQDQVAG